MNFTKNRFPNADFSQIGEINFSDKKRMKQVILLRMAQEVARRKLSSKKALALNFLKLS